MIRKDLLPLTIIAVVIAAALILFLVTQSDGEGPSLAPSGPNDRIQAPEAAPKVEASRAAAQAPVAAATSAADAAAPLEGELVRADREPSEWHGLIMGRVIERTSGAERPVNGAQVALCLDVSDHNALTLQGEVVKLAETDAEGRFAIEEVPVDGRYLMRVEHPDFASKYVSHLELQSREKRGLEVVLTAGLSISGVVKDKAGQAIEGAEVFAEDQTMRVADLTQGIERRTLTDAEGRFEIRNLTSGYKRVSAAKSGYSTASNPTVFVNGGHTDPLEFELGQGASIAGQVVNEDDGTPVPGVFVTAVSLRSTTVNQSYPSVRCGEDGHFVYDGLEIGQYRLMVMKPGYSGFGARVVAQTGDDTLVIKIKRNPVIKGRVIEAGTGQPIRRFSVVASAKDSAAFTSVRQTRQYDSEDGSFEYTSELTEGQVWLFAEAPGHAGGRSTPVTVTDTTSIEGVIIELSTGSVVKGRVVDSKGEAVGGVTVRLRANREGDAPGFLGGLLDSMRTRNYSAETGADGRYEIVAVTEGSYKISASRIGYCDSTAERSFDVGAAGETQAPEFKLLRGATLSGVVRDKDGTPAAGVTVRLSARANVLAGASHTVRSDDKGRYQVKNITPGIYFVDAIKNTGDPSSIFELGSLLNPAGRPEVVLGDEEDASLDLNLP